MKSTAAVLPGPGGTPAGTTCRYPGCGNPVRDRSGDRPGAPPRYCGLTVAEDRGEAGTTQVTHSALTAFRRYNDKGEFLYDPPGPNPPAPHQGRRHDTVRPA